MTDPITAMELRELARQHALGNSEPIMAAFPRLVDSLRQARLEANQARLLEMVNRALAVELQKLRGES